LSVGAFHRSLRSRGKGAKDWSNSFTEHEYLGVNEEGKHSYGVNLSVGHRVFKDKVDGQWKKHKLTDERPAKDYVLVQGAKCCVEVYPYYAKYFDVDHEEVRLHEERWVVQRLFKEPDKWRDVGAWNPVMAVEEGADFIKVSVTYDTDYGVLTVEYFQRDGNALKHNVYFINESGGEETFRVLQRWAGIVGGKCNGKTVPMVEDAGFLAFHRTDRLPRDFSIAENLWGMMFNPDGSEKTDQRLQRPVVIETHAQGMKVDFIYAKWVLAQGESLEIDPDTVTLSNPTEDGHINFNFVTTYTRDKISLTFDVGCDDFEEPQPILMKRAYVEWNVSSIPDNAIVSDTVFRYHGSDHDIDCHIHEMLGAQPSVQANNNAGNQAIYDEAGEGTVYADPAGFPEVGENKQVDLGASADSDLQSQLSSDWFAIGIQADTEVSALYSTIYSEERATANPKPTLYVEYTPTGWQGKISGITDPAKIMGIPVADIAKVKGIA